MIFRSVNAVLAATPMAIISGRGGRNQHSCFHQEFLSERDRLQTLFQYKNMRIHIEKQNVQSELIAWVENQGGAFYRKNETAIWIH